MLMMGVYLHKRSMHYKVFRCDCVCKSANITIENSSSQEINLPKQLFQGKVLNVSP